MSNEPEARLPWRLRGLPVRQILGLRVRVADRTRARLLGLAVLSRRRAGAGLLIPRCRSVHTFAMRFPLTIVFLDSAGRITSRRQSVPPGRIVVDLRADSVLELPAEPRPRRG